MLPKGAAKKLLAYAPQHINIRKKKTAVVKKWQCKHQNAKQAN